MKSKIVGHRKTPKTPQEFHALGAKLDLEAKMLDPQRPRGFIVKFRTWDDLERWKEGLANPTCEPHARENEPAEHDHESERDQERLDRAVWHHDAEVRGSLALLRIDPRALVINLLSFPERISAGHCRNLGEVVFRRWAWNCPLECSRTPRIRARDLTALPALEEVVDEE